MGDSYLNSGEFIILTTHQISVNAVISEMMLTNERLILVDTSYARFRPQTIPLSSIVKVMTGLTPAGEPVITLSLVPIKDADGPEAIDLIFTQRPWEQRKRECEEWVKKLMGNIVSVRQKAIRTGTISADRDAGIQPSTRRWIAPDKLSPHTTDIKPRPVLTEVEITPPQHEVTVKSEEETESPVEKEEEVQPVVKSQADRDETLTPPVLIILERPEDEEFLVSSITTAAIPDIPHSEEPETPESPTVPDEKTFPAATRVYTRPEIEELSPAPEIPEELPDTVPETPEIGWPVISAQEESPSQITAHPASGEIVEPFFVKDDYTDLPETSVHEVPVFAGSDKSQAGEQAQLTPPHSSPPPRSRRQTAVAVIAVVIVFMVIAGGLFFISLSMTGETREPGTLKVTQTPVIRQTMTPAPTAITATGDWVRVIYPREYIGQVGNPEILRTVYGTGDHFYKIVNSNAIIQASIQKQDNFGDPLIVEVYSDGELIDRRTVTAPMGSVDIVIDTRKAHPPGIVPVVTNSGTQNGSRGNTIIYL